MSEKESSLIDLKLNGTAAPNIIVKAIGVGGGGGNAVAQMYADGIEGVEFLVCNSDKKAIDDSPVPNKLPIGTLGCGGDPAKGKERAEEHIEEIDKALSDGTRMAFITAGMGGGTGTGASPVIAREAKKLGILTVGVVTLPFLFEQQRQIDKALDGLDVLAREVDSLLIINNQRVLDIYPSLSVIDGFKKADETLTNAVSSIVNIIGMRGKMNLDFEDVYSVLHGGGVSVISSATASGESRVTQAIEKAIYSPLLNNRDVYRSQKIAVSIAFNPAAESTLMMEEFNEIHNFMRKFGPDVWTKWGLREDSSLGDKVEIIILASGFGLYADKPEEEETTLSAEDENRRKQQISGFYPEMASGHRPLGRRKRPSTYIFSQEDLDNEKISDIVDSTPTYKRTEFQMRKIFAISKPKVEEKKEETQTETSTVISFDMTDKK